MIGSRKDDVLGITLTKHTAFNVRITPRSKIILIEDTDTERYVIGRKFYITYKKAEPPIRIIFNDIDGRLYEQILTELDIGVILTAPKEISKPFKSVFSKR